MPLLDKVGDELRLSIDAPKREVKTSSRITLDRGAPRVGPKKMQMPALQPV